MMLHTVQQKFHLKGILRRIFVTEAVQYNLQIMLHISEHMMMNSEPEMEIETFLVLFATIVDYSITKNKEMIGDFDLGSKHTCIIILFSN